MWRAGLLAIGIGLVPGAIQSAWAQTASADGLGEVHAVSFRELPDRLRLSVTLLDDSNLDLRIRDEMVASLMRAKHTLADDAPFELELSSEVKPARQSAGDPSLGRLSSNMDDTQFEMNIWSSSQDSILGGRHSGNVSRTGSRFEIRATLRERSLGDVVWEGRSVVAAEQDQVEPYVARMAQALVESLGRTVRNGSFPVP